MYESPITKIFGEIQTEINRRDEEFILTATRNIGYQIDKEQLVKALQYDRDQYKKGYSDAIKETRPRWIPVTERFPEEDGRYLCTYENEFGICVDFGKFYKGDWFVGRVTAWMPLPKPYKEENIND